jgi:mRNA interferase RelE/StbE
LTYRLILQRSARRALAALPAKEKIRIARAVYVLADDPRPRGVRKLSGSLGWRIRVGEYRVLYTISDRERFVSVEDVLRRTTTTYD